MGKKIFKKMEMSLWKRQFTFLLEISVGKDLQMITLHALESHIFRNYYS